MKTTKNQTLPTTLTTEEPATNAATATTTAKPRKAASSTTPAKSRKTTSSSPSTPSFEEFATGVYPFLELQRFHRIYFRLLELFAEGRIRKLMVSMPPQHGKSIGASTLLPAYMLGLNPDTRIAIASYSSSLANKFNRRVQRILESREYASMFPATRIKQGGKPPQYLRTADEVEIIDHDGGLLSVGREGSLTGNRVDCFILDDLYKDAMEAYSPVVRENCWEWYTSVVKTRMHNNSRELIVFTRWHEEDLIGTLRQREEVCDIRRWSDIEHIGADVWVALNFEALMTAPPSEIDGREVGEALWPERQSASLLEAKRRLDAVRFESMYQGRPSSRGGLLYGDGFREWDTLPRDIVRYANYTDTADMGDDYLCSLCYMVDSDGVIYITDAVYSREPMELTELAVARMLQASNTRIAFVESNNGGRGFARAVSRLTPRVRVNWFHQSGNKEARILSNSATVQHLIRFPRGWAQRWPELYTHLTTYRREFYSNRWHDAADVVTGIVEMECSPEQGRILKVGFIN